LTFHPIWDIEAFIYYTTSKRLWSTPFSGTIEMATERKTYGVEEAGKVLGISRNTAYEAARSGELPTIKIGKRLLVPKAALDRLLESAGQST
jgi:excisionase family DNA binding protein